jgi:inorganic pyrophosphatase
MTVEKLEKMGKKGERKLR